MSPATRALRTFEMRASAMHAFARSARAARRGAPTLLLATAVGGGAIGWAHARTAPGHAADVAALDIPHRIFVLPNGLTVLVHEDHKAPIVAIGVWYHVGSKDEPAGKTGFAHLFEHLMFNGSENH
jgi:hypothetical protein